MEELITRARQGFSTIAVDQQYISKALQFLLIWLTEEQFRDYLPQIDHLISNRHWNYLLDSFYQVIPFGTGGRRGEVGVGPNRINPWTIKASAQGHSQYLLKKHGNRAREQGIVFAYDVRVFTGNAYLNDAVPNPVKNLTSKDLAVAAAEVYAANGIKVHLFNDIRTTPELSFAIRYLKTIAGAMFSASHNPPDHNGEKVYDESGGQLIPPEDEILVTEVAENTGEIKDMPCERARQQGLVVEVSPMVDEEYRRAARAVSLSRERDLRIAYTPLHGCGMTSVYEVLKDLGFEVLPDPKTSNPSGRFENITFNIPNPEVVQSFDTTRRFAEEENADVILSSDPDADRTGIMVKHNREWVFLNGNEIAAVLAEYAARKSGPGKGDRRLIVTTTVTTSLLGKICERNGIDFIGSLLIGFKYIADVMNGLQSKGEAARFLFACEESHGYIAGTYARDKDAAAAAVWLAELSAELKKESKTVVDYLDEIYSKYGYFRNYVAEIRLLGAAGKEKIDRIQMSLRKNPPKCFGRFKVDKHEDCRERKPIVSGTDASAKDILIFHLAPVENVESIKITVRPSGTEPKIKMYFEMGNGPVAAGELDGVKRNTEGLLRRLEKDVMTTCYGTIGVDFPERGFLLFSQIPLDDKLKYFRIEPEIEQLRSIEDRKERNRKLLELISFLGANPVEKVDDAFRAGYGVSVLKYLDLEHP